MWEREREWDVRGRVGCERESGMEEREREGCESGV